MFFKYIFLNKIINGLIRRRPNKCFRSILLISYNWFGGHSIRREHQKMEGTPNMGKAAKAFTKTHRSAVLGAPLSLSTHLHNVARAYHGCWHYAQISILAILQMNQFWEVGIFYARVDDAYYHFSKFFNVFCPKRMSSLRSGRSCLVMNLILSRTASFFLSISFVGCKTWYCYDCFFSH